MVKSDVFPLTPRGVEILGFTSSSRACIDQALEDFRDRYSPNVTDTSMDLPSRKIDRFTS